MFSFYHKTKVDYMGKPYDTKDKTTYRDAPHQQKGNQKLNRNDSHNA